MKRFWVFVIICVVCLGIGFTIFRFMTKEEMFYVNQTVYEINSGDDIELDIVCKNLKSGTEVTAVSADPTIIANTGEKDGKFVFNARLGGTTAITVSTNRSDLPKFTILVTVGDGSYATPYLIKTQDQLEMIGKPNGQNAPVYGLNKCYKLVSNINLTDDWTPIGEGIDEGFTGNFDFNGKAISNLSITSIHASAGLFAKVGTNGFIKGSNLSAVNIQSNSSYVGALAGINLGTIESATLTGVTVSNTNANAFVGGLVGLNNGSISKSQIKNSRIVATGADSVVGGLVGKSALANKATDASVSRSSAECSVQGGSAVGGLVGQNTGAIIENCFAGSLGTDCTITSGAGSYAGGIVGINDFAEIDDVKYRSYLGDTYAVMKFANSSTGYNGAIIGHNINIDGNHPYFNVIYGSYYSKEVNEGLKGINSQTNPSTDPDALGIEDCENVDLMKESTYLSFKTATKQYKWQFAEGVWTIDAGKDLPKLNFNLGYISSRVANFIPSTIITDVDGFIRLKNANPQLVYKLGNTIDLVAGENYTPFDFNGKLTCDLDENNLPLYAINLTIKKEEGVVDGIAALFKTLGSSGSLTNIRVNVTIEDISTAHHIAALVGINDGAISNCFVSNERIYGKIATDYTGNDTLYVGGVAAENKGKVTLSKSYVDITYSKSPALCYFGGIAGYSTNTIEKSNNYGTISVTGKAGESYVGGIVGHTNSQVLTCANYGDIIGEPEANNTVYAGIAAYIDNNSDASIKYCANYADITGSNVGGVVGISLGAIEFCCNKGALTGKYVGGLAYEIKLGYMKNSMTDGCTLYGLSENGVLCGAVYSIDVTSNHSAYCEYIFSSCNFGGQGEKYYESASNIRGYARWWKQFISAIDMHAFDNSIHVERSGDIERSYFDPNIDAWDYRNGTNDIEITEGQANGTDGVYSVFNQYGYSQAIWNYSSSTIGSYIQIRGIAK